MKVLSKAKSIYLFFIVSLLLTEYSVGQPGPIQRKEVVDRHNVKVAGMDTLSSLTVGNGKFAFTVDGTGLQSFPDEYAAGVPLGTQSEWGWHAFPNLENFTGDETLEEYDLNGKKVKYAVQIKSPERKKNASEYFRQNQHRLQLGNIGLELIKRDGSQAKLKDITAVRQQLVMWEGAIYSTFEVEGIPVSVSTVCHPEEDAVSVLVSSRLIAEGRLKVRLRFPYPTGEWSDRGNHWKDQNKHSSKLLNATKNGMTILHSIDTTSYHVSVQWNLPVTMTQGRSHTFLFIPKEPKDLEMTFRFEKNNLTGPLPGFWETLGKSRAAWETFWKSGGAIDFAGSTDPRAMELERRMVLSQYLLRVQEAGDFPPQETGLTYNSWYGKPHMEMHYWHSMQYALWGRTDLLERSMAWYEKAATTAKSIAKRQGYDGVRWQKMTDNAGREVPSSIGAFLIWQQPHFIYFAELCFRANGQKSLDRYKDLVFATADFIASFPEYDAVRQRYVLGKGVISAQERFKAEETFNPTYELVYWDWALKTAQQWRERLGLPRNKKWDDVMNKLSTLPVKDDRYLFTESATDSYTRAEYKTDHPAVFGAYGMMPQTGKLDTVTMRKTFDWIWNNWTWNATWGWDFPMTAMTATRLNKPEKAIESLLMNIKTNTYLPNGHNYQSERLTIYLPGNGGLLAALAMMVAGHDGSGDLPGIPKNGKWKVRWEGLQKMP